MSNKKTITQIVRKNDECVIYNDDGIYCQWSDIKPFNFDTIAEAKANATGKVVLITEDEMAEFTGERIRFDDHEKWVIPRWLIWQVYGDLETADDEEAKTVEFMRGLLI